MKKRVKKHLALLTAAVVMVLTVMSWLPGSTYEVKAVTSEVQVNSIAGIKNAFDTCTGDSDFYVELQEDIAISADYLSDGPVFTLTAGKLTVDLNGHSLDASASTTSGTIFCNTGGNLTITDSSSSKGGKVVSPPNGVLVRSEGGTLDISGGSFEKAAQCLSIQNTTVNITEGSFVTDKNGNTDIALMLTGDDSIVTISGDSNFESAYGTIWVQDTVKAGSSLTIEGGTFTADENGAFSYACYVGGVCELAVSGGTFNLNADNGSGLYIGTASMDAQVNITGGTYNGRIARGGVETFDQNYTAFYGDGTGNSGILGKGCVLTDNKFYTQGDVVFTQGNVQVVSGSLLKFNTQRTCLESFEDSETVENVKADYYSLDPVSVGTDGTVYTNTDSNATPGVEESRVTDGNIYEFRGWVDEEGTEYASPDAYITAMGGKIETTELSGIWNAKSTTAAGFEHAITSNQAVRNVEVTEDITLSASVLEMPLDLPTDRVLNLGGHTISYALSDNPALVLNSAWSIKNGSINSSDQACLQIEGTAVLENVNCTAQNSSYVVGFSNVAGDSANRIISGTFETTLEGGHALRTTKKEEIGTSEDITNLLRDSYASSTETTIDGADTYLSASKLIVSQTPITYIGNGADVDMSSHIYGEEIPVSEQAVSNREYMGDIIITGVSVDNPVFEVTGEGEPKKLVGQSADTYSYTVGVAENTDVGNYTGTVSVTYTRMDGSTGTYTQKLAVTITPKQLTITEPSVTREKVYDGMTEAQVKAGVLEGVVTGDDVAVTAVAVYENADAGSGKQISVSYTLSGTDKDNYLTPVDDKISDGVINRAEGTASVRITDYYVGQKAQPVVSSQTNGTTAVTFYYKQKDAAQDTYTTAEPEDEGSYTVKAVFAATKNYNAVEAVADFTVSYIDTPECPYTLFGKKGNDGWYTSEVFIYPPEGYLISTGQSGTYEKYCTIESTAEPVIYLKDENGAVTRPVQVEKLQIDKKAPEITGVEDGKIYEASRTAEITDDNLKRVTLNGVNILFSGTTANVRLKPSSKEYVLEAEDKAGNTVKYTFHVEISIRGDGARSLIRGEEYKLGSGLWKVNGDNTVYNGNLSFYVTNDGEYEFQKQ